MNIFVKSFVASAALLVAAAAVPDNHVPNVATQAEMKAAVVRLVKAAGKLKTLYPWQGPIAEVHEAALYGKAIAPLLVRELDDDPDNLDDSHKNVNWNVQQQVALALCEIYAVTAEAGHVYDNRTSRETNANVKRFWSDVITGKTD